LSSGKRTPRIITVVVSAVTTVAISATALAGLVGWQPASAMAATAPESPMLFGVDSSTAVYLGPAVPTISKFEGALANTTVSSETSLAAPAQRRSTVAKTPYKPAKPVVKKPTKKAKKAPKYRPKTGWKRSRVSWYGPGLYGNGMAGGGKLRRNSMVVAHRTMKFGTKIQFRYHGRTVVAVVKDRGPYISGRTFDLGPGTAKALHFDGVGNVKWRIVK